MTERTGRASTVRTRAVRGVTPRAVTPRARAAVSARDLRVDGLDAAGEPTTSLSGVSFDVRPGEVVAVLGRRGAGVSTLLSTVTGRLVPAAGTVRLWGRDPAADAGQVHRLVAAVPPVAGLPPRLTVRESLQLWGDLHPAPRDVEEEVLALAGLQPLARVRAGRLDPGAAQRLLVAVAFVGGTPAVVCDEPAGGHAPGTGEAVAALAASAAAQGATVLLACAQPTDVVPVLDRVVLLRRGRLVTVAAPDDVVARYCPHGAASVLLADPDEASRLSGAAPGATFHRSGSGTLVEFPDLAAQELTTLTRTLGSLVRAQHRPGTLADAVRRATADRRSLPERWRRFGALVAMADRECLRDVRLLVLVLVLPAVVVVTMTLAAETTQDARATAYDPAAFLLPGTTPLAVLLLALPGTVGPVVHWRTTGVLRLLVTAGGGTGGLPWALLPSRAVLALVSAAGTVLVCAAAGVLHLRHTDVPALVLTGALGAAALLAGGVLVATLVRSVAEVRVLVWAGSVVLAVLGGILVPPFVLPGPAAVVLGWTPTAVFADAWRALLTGAAPAHPVWASWTVSAVVLVAAVTATEVVRRRQSVPRSAV